MCRLHVSEITNSNTLLTGLCGIGVYSSSSLWASLVGEGLRRRQTGD